MSKTNDELYELIVDLQNDVNDIKEEMALLQTGEGSINKNARVEQLKSCECDASLQTFLRENCLTAELIDDKLMLTKGYKTE